MKRLLCIVNTMNAGGAETFLMKIYRKLDRSKYQMDFCVCEAGKQYYEDEIKGLGGKIYHIHPKSKNISVFKKELYNVVKSNQYKYVLKIASNAIGFFDLKIAFEAGALRCICRSSNSSDGGSIKMRLLNTISRVLYDKYVDVRIAPSDLAAIYTFGNRTYTRGSVIMLHNAIDIKQYAYDAFNREKIRHDYAINKEEIVIGHVGRFQKQKNHLFLIDVFAEIHKVLPNSKLLLVGDGELASEIKCKIIENNLQESVIMSGIQSNVSAYLSAMDLFVFPSLYEGMPNTVIEAQAAGLQCIISDTITKEANITGQVKYISLQTGIKPWVDCIINTPCKRYDPTERFIEKKYDIESATEQFVNVVFGDNNEV